MTARSRIAAVPLALVALVVGACATSYPYASVAGTDIDRDDVYDYADLDPGASGGVLPGDGVRAGVTELVFDAAAVAAAETDFGVVITEADVEQRMTEPPPRWIPVFGDAGLDSEVPRARLESIAVRTLLVDTVGAELVMRSYGSWDQLLETDPARVTKVCLRHLVVPTEAEAEEALTRIEAGEDLATVATEVSLDSLNPEGLVDAANCPSHLIGVPPEFAELLVTLPVGEAGGPVQTDSGFHVVRVEERIIPTAAELEAEPLDHLQVDDAINTFTQWFAGVTTDAEVEVASEVGRWAPDLRTVVPPGG